MHISHSISNIIDRLSLLAITLFVMLIMTLAGCSNQHPQKIDQSKVGYATADIMSVSLFYPISMMLSINNTNLSPEQVACIQQIDYKASIPTYQKYIEDKFSTEEISTLDGVYSTQIGDKLKTIATQSINQMVVNAQVEGTIKKLSENLPSEDTPIELTAEEKRIVKELVQSELGKKLTDAVMGDTYMNEGLDNHTLPALKKELENCKVTVPTKEEMGKWMRMPKM